MREKIATSLERFSSYLRLLPTVVILIMANAIWVPGGLYASGGAEIVLHVGSSEDPEECEKGMYLGQFPVECDDSFVCSARELRPVVRGYPTAPYLSAPLPDEIRIKFIESQREDTTTSYCGFAVSHGRLYGTNEVQISDSDMEKLRGVLAQCFYSELALKFTINGRRVRVEPLQACCSDGKCVKDGLLWDGESCPEGTVSAGKATCCGPGGKCKSVSQARTDRKDFEERACCITNGPCLLLNADGCKTVGTFMPDKRSCTPNPCAKAKNGCCLNGKCVDLPRTECGEQCGTPLYRPCSGNFEEDCGSLTGACMVGTNCEPFQTECSCVQYLSGKYQGNGTRCPPPQLPTPQVPKGACCFNGECNLETQADCSKKGDSAVFLPGKTCDPNPCQQPEPPKGGCCDIFGKCEENVSEAECLLRQDARFFPDGCPGTCPPVEGACYVPCALSPSVMDCSTVSIRECAAKNNARFEPNKKCPDPDIKTCENCGPCEQAYATGEWFLTLQDEKGELTLLSDCKATMVMEKLGGDRATNLPTAQSPIIRREGKWHCSGENVIVDFDGVKSTLVINKERATPRLCYRDGGKLICAERKPPPDERKPRSDETLFVISVGGIGASPDWAGKSLVQSGSHEEIFRLKRGQDLRTELEAYHSRLLGDVCEIVNPPGMISKDAPPQIFNWAEITVLTGPITDVKQLEGRSLKDTWKTINENGISLGELRKRGGCGN